MMPTVPSSTGGTGISGSIDLTFGSDCNTLKAFAGDLCCDRGNDLVAAENR